LRPLEASDPPVVGHYRTLAELGRGGMGRVLLGSGPDGRLVAVKLVDEQLVDDDGFRARFRREVKASRKVAGAYTAAVIDADADAPTPWLASVYVPGPSLREALLLAGVLTGEPALRLAAGLAAALVEVHRAGLVHRDLKPSNVLLTDDGLRVIDFGIARATETEGDTQVTRTGGLIGTPGFMSPEQALGRELTTASDVFSLGSVLVYACTGAGPFDAGDTPQTLHNVVHIEPDLDALPGGVAEIALACLAKDPAARPTPQQLLARIGGVAPAARPWPAAVHQLIAAQHAEVDQLLPASPGQGPVGSAEIRSDAGTVVYPPLDRVGVPDGPPRATAPGGGGPTRRRVLWMGGGAILGLTAVGGLVAWTSSKDGHPAAGAGRTAGAAAAKRPIAVLGDHPGDVDEVTFTPDGKLLVTTCGDGMVRFWDLDARQLSGEPLKASTGMAPCAAFNPTGDVLATGGDPGVTLWDVATRRQVAQLTVPVLDVLGDSSGLATDVGFSPDGRTLAAVGSDTMQLWDAYSRKRLGQLDFRRSSLLTKVAFSGDGRTMAVSDHSTVQLWDVASKQQVGQSLLGHTATVTNTVFSPDGRTLATGAGDMTVRLWDVPTGRPVGQPLRGYSGGVNALAFTSDGRRLATGASDDGTVRLWDVATQRPLGQPITGRDRSQMGVALGQDNRTLAMAVGKTVELWDVSALTRG
jgi:eukaryotic-like serine/threonine-protein kinase